ncbi:MAG: hypothetical protein JWQ54_865 [Mucilaginibacter sp.]|nr:hypothetical protein [Mucilaginibacter sp.]
MNSEEVFVGRKHRDLPPAVSPQPAFKMFIE